MCTFCLVLAFVEGDSVAVSLFVTLLFFVPVSRALSSFTVHCNFVSLSHSLRLARPLVEVVDAHSSLN